ncbi:hypothetical protein BH23ACT9_BH23ACT9_15860 [soil metagenome]
MAGLGNIFQGDDGFGVEVVRRLRDRPVPDGVTVTDIGIRGVHLAYELLDGWDRVLLVDAAQHGAAPGTVSVLDPGRIAAPEQTMLMDAHDMGPEAVLALVVQMGGALPDVRIIACEPADTTPGMSLSDPVSGAVDAAVEAVVQLLIEEMHVPIPPATAKEPS